MQQFKIDDDTLAFAARELTVLRSKVYEREYPEKKMANGQILPIEVMTEASWADEVEIEEYDIYGIMQVIADYSRGGNRVGVSTRRMRYPIRTIGAHAGYSLEEVNKARFAQKPLQAQRLRALRESYDNYQDQLGYYGDVNYGLQGLLTLPLPQMISATPMSAVTSADDLLALLNSYVGAILEATNGIESPKKMVLPEAQYRRIFSTYRTNTSETIGEAFLRSQRAQGLINEIIIDVKLKKALNGKDVAVLLPDDVDKISLGVAIPYTMLPEQVQNMEFVTHSYARVAGVMCKYPLSTLIVTNI